MPDVAQDALDLIFAHAAGAVVDGTTGSSAPIARSCARIHVAPVLGRGMQSRLIGASCVAMALAGCGGGSRHGPLTNDPLLAKAARAPWVAVMHLEPRAFCDAVTPAVAASIIRSMRPPGTPAGTGESCRSFMEAHIGDVHLRMLANASIAEQDQSDLEAVTVHGGSAIVAFRPHTLTLPADGATGAIPTVVPASAYPYRVALVRGADGRWRLAPAPPGLDN